MRPRLKYHVIHLHHKQYSIMSMCSFFGVSRSGYYVYVKRLSQKQRDADLAEIIGRCQHICGKTYGYRRVWLWLKRQNIHKNPKTVLRIMKKYGLLAEIRRRRKWQNLGQQVHRYRNNYVPSREFTGAIQQIEKYSFCLNTLPAAKEKVCSAISRYVPKGFPVRILNPQGMLLLGRSNRFNKQQQEDFELIKRQYKHIADIMTYDDLLSRLKNIITALSHSIGYEHQIKTPDS